MSSNLAYAILRDPGPDLPATTAEGLPLARIVGIGLAAAVSVVPVESAWADESRLQAYAATIAELHRRGTILPLRFGCLLGTIPDVAVLLARRRAEFLAGLDELDGCEEMGLRVWIGPDLPPGAVQVAPAGALAPSRLGTAYLAARRVRLSGRDPRRAEADRTADRIRHALQGTYVKCLAADPGVSPLLALNFLIRRADRERFRRAVAALEDEGGRRMLLSGPLPPFNFSTPFAIPGMETIRPAS